MVAFVITIVAPHTYALSVSAKTALVKAIVFTKDISTADKALVKKLFTNNDMPNIKGVVVYSVESESAVGPDKATFNHIRTRYTFNGIETEKEVLYHFKNGMLNHVTGDPTFPKSFAKAKISKVKALTIAKKQFKMVAPVATSKILYSVAGSGDNVPMVMGWYVHPKGQEYPYVTINALTGAVISADNGIRY